MWKNHKQQILSMAWCCCVVAIKQPIAGNGACSVNIPTLVISGGTMLKGHWKGKDFGILMCGVSMQLHKLGQITHAGICRLQKLLWPVHRAFAPLWAPHLRWHVMVEALGLITDRTTHLFLLQMQAEKLFSQLSGGRIVEMVKTISPYRKFLHAKAFETCNHGECCDWRLHPIL
jgi:dihydroxy-acid dehydratase